MKKWTLLSVMLFTLSVMFAQNQTLKLDAKASKLQWTGKSAVGNYALTGDIEAKNGELILVEKDINTANVVINMKTIFSSEKSLMKHLKAADFFEVKSFPEASFELEELRLSKDGTPLAKGWLTIKDQRKAFECPVEVTNSDAQQIVKGKATVDRTAYGIIYNSTSYFKDIGDHAIADEFELDFEFVFK